MNSIYSNLIKRIVMINGPYNKLNYSKKNQRRSSNMLKRKTTSYSEEFQLITTKIKKILQTPSQHSANDENYTYVLNDIKQMLTKIRELRIPMDQNCNISIISEYIIKMQNLPDNIFGNINNPKDLFLTLDLLANIQSLQYTKYQTNLTPFLLKCFTMAKNQKAANFDVFWQKLTDFFVPLFKNSLFSFKFFNNSLYQEFFTSFIPQCVNSQDNFKLFTSFIINTPNSNSFNSITIKNILQDILSSYQTQSDYSELQLFFIDKLFKRISKSEEMANLNLPSIIDQYSDSKEKWVTFFSLLLYSQSESSTKSNNQEIYTLFLNLCRTNPEKQSSVFQILRSYKHYEEVQASFPLVHFFKDFEQPIQDLLNFLTEIIANTNPNDSFIQQIFPKLLQKVFRIFSIQMIDNPNQYQQLIQIIQASKVDFDGNPSKLLTCFLRTPSSSTLNLIFEDRLVVDLMIHYFSLPISKEIQPLIFRSLLEHCENTGIIVQFLKSSVTKVNILCLMDFILSNPNEKLFLILLSAFHDGPDVAEKFIACDGLLFLEKCFKENVMSIEYYSFIISSLVMEKPFPEIDEFILSLNKDHKLFSMSQKHLENIVYGKNGGKFRPIRVPSLFHLLENKAFIDPYNSYSIGKFGLQSYLENGCDIYDIPFIKEVGNRYLSSHHIDLMMKNPKNFNQFCDRDNFDHFSLLVLYPMQKDLVFKGNFNAVSFWIKFESLPEIKSEKFFKDDNAHLYINSHLIICEIFVNSELGNKSGNVKRFQTEIKSRWIHFYIITEKTWKSTTKTIFINGELKFSSNLQSFPKDKPRIVVFGNYEHHLMYIGPAIRFFENQELKGSNDPFAMSIYDKKPQCISRLLNVQETIITPYNITKKNMEIQIAIPQNCYIVPYFGFPFHFISKRRLSDLFFALRNSKDEASFRSIFDALLSINLIVYIDQDRFFRNLLESMILYKQFLSNKLLSNDLQSISKQHPSGIILMSIFFEPNMFEKDDLSLFLEIFLDSFKQSGFSKLPEFELILLATIHKHPECTSVLMANLDRFPKLHELLVDTLKYKKKSNDLQLRIVDGYSQIVQSSTSDAKQIYLLKQVSPCLITPSKSLSAQIFRLMTTIAIKSHKPFPVTNSVVYSVMKLVEFEPVWICVKELNRAFKNGYISLLLGLVWSRSFGTLFLLSFYDKPVDLLTTHYLNGINYLIGNVVDIVQDPFCSFIITNLFPILSNLTHLETTRCLDSQSLLDFTQSILESFGAIRPEYYIFKPLVTNKFFSETPLVQLYSRILIECNSLSMFNQFFFPLIVGSPFHDLDSEYFPLMALKFLENYEPFQNSQRFFNLLLYPIAKNMFSHKQILRISTIIFNICKTENRYNEIMHLILYSIIIQHQTDIKCQQKIETIFHSNLSILYRIMINRKSQLTWFAIFSQSKRIIEGFLSYEWTQADKQILVRLSQNDNIDLKQNLEAFNIYYKNCVKQIAYEFVNDDRIYQNDHKNFFNGIDKAIFRFQENSHAIRQKYHSQKLLFQENMRWANLLSYLSDQMSDISLFRSHIPYLNPKCLPYLCPKRLAHSIFSTKDEIVELFQNHTTQINDTINPRLFLRSESSLLDNPMIVDCKLCRYMYEIPSVMFLYNTCFLFLTYAELSSQDEIKFLENDDYKFIESVFLGHWGPTSLFSSHIVIRTMFDQLISIQISKKKQFNVWTFRQGSFTIKMDVKKLMQVQYAISSAALQGLDALSPYPFLFTVDNYSSAFDKWSKNEISTDELLLVANGLARRNFHSLQEYPYFPFIFQHNPSILAHHHQLSPKNLVSKSPSAPLTFSSASESDTTIHHQLDIYSVPKKGKETAAFLRTFLPFSYFLKTHQNLLDLKEKALLSRNQDVDHARSTSSFISSSRSSFRQSTDSILLYTDSDDSSSDLKLNSMKSVGASGQLEPILKTKNSTDELPRTSSLDLEHSVINTILSDDDEKNQKNALIKHHVSFNPENISEIEKSETQQRQASPGKKIPTFISFSSMSSSVLSPFSKQHKRRYSFTPTSNLKPSIRSTLERIDLIIREFACNDSTHHESQLSKLICPANFFYTPELLQNYSDNPLVCIQKHRKEIEDPRNSEFIMRWIMHHCFDVNIDSAPSSKKLMTNRQINYTRFKPVFSLDLIHLSQILKKSCKSSKRFMFTNDNKLKRIKRISSRLLSSYFAVIDKKLLSLSIIDYSNSQKRRSHVVCSIVDNFFAFSKSISVSRNGMFISVDFAFGVTHVYRVIYSKSIPQSIKFLSDFSCNISPLSVVDGTNFLCCTAIKYQLVLWDIFDGYIHTVVGFNDSGEITSISHDQDFGIWAATEKSIYYVSINGQILAQIDISEKISEIESVPMPSSIFERAAVCGTVSGKLYIITPRFDTKTIDSKELKGKHAHEIKQIVINNNLKMFISVDAKNKAVLWTAFGVKSEPLNVSMFGTCALCHRKPKLHCASCNRAVCSNCILTNMCKTCYSMSLI